MLETDSKNCWLTSTASTSSPISGLTEIHYNKIPLYLFMCNQTLKPPNQLFYRKKKTPVSHETASMRQTVYRAYIPYFAFSNSKQWLIMSIVSFPIHQQFRSHRLSNQSLTCFKFSPLPPTPRSGAHVHVKLGFFHVHAATGAGFQS